MSIQKINKERGSLSPLGWLLLIIVGLWILWYYSGGPQNPNVNRGPFVEPNAPLGNGQGYGTVGQ